MRLVVGLGNPGPKYRNNRHNIGFMAADEIVRRHGLPAPRARFQGKISEGAIAGERVGVLKPTTFMNESGRSVGEALRFFKLAPEDVIVIHDEIDLAAGKLRVKRGGGHAGHNGLRSIESHLGSRDFCRVRLGVGHPGEKARVHGHVLGNFTKEDEGWVRRELEAAAEHLPLLFEGRDSDFMSRVAMAQQDRATKKRKAAPEAADTADGPPPDADGEDTPGTTLGDALSRAIARLRGRD